jgi:uncharacterized protein YtpQ (UPF0354 family)
MRRLLAVFLVLAGVCVAAYAQTLPPGPFTSQFARALQAAMPSVSMSVSRDLQLIVRRGDGTSATVNLDNAYRDYTSEPARFDQLVKTFAAALAKPGQPAKLDRTHIMPVIKDRAWLAQLQEAFKKQDGSQQPVYEDFNNELVLVYAEDNASRTRYLSSSENLGVARTELRALAVDNLVRVLPKIEMRQHDDGFFMMTSHADYGASLLLIDEIWSGGQIKVDGDTVVAVPAKDVILVTGSRNRKGLQAVRRVAHDLAKGSYGLIETLFAYRKDKFVKFGRN